MVILFLNAHVRLVNRVSTTPRFRYPMNLIMVALILRNPSLGVRP